MSDKSYRSHRPYSSGNSAIILATANARYSHAALGLRWIWANMGPLREAACIREFTISQSPEEIAQNLLENAPRIIGLGVYIWNVTLLTEVARRIKAAKPDVVLVAGGPEAAHEHETLPLSEYVDYIVCGEGEMAFAELAGAVLDGRSPAEKVIAAPPPDLACLALPYASYSDEDIARRLIYVEASRGCPFRCAFCLSAADAQVREFPLEGFLAAMAQLIDRGTRQFKFVDRTFNVRFERMAAILGFFLERWQPGMRLHLEIVPDRLTEPMLDLFAQFPPGALHIETGVQSLNPETLEAVARPQNAAKTLRNLRLLNEMGALVHADVIAGLPFETWDTFSSGFDELAAVAPRELQVGILKRLKGAPLAQRAFSHGLVFARQPPYEVMQTAWLDAAEIEHLKRFARYFDLYHNSGNFPACMPLLRQTQPSAFAAFERFFESVWVETRRTFAIPLAEQTRLLHDFLVQNGVDAETTASAVRLDFYRLPGRKDKLPFLT